MTDLVKRLRGYDGYACGRDTIEAADRIEALERELAEAKKEATAASEEADQARGDADEAAIWPEWARQIHLLLKRYGFEESDDGVDLPQQLADWLEGYRDAAEQSRDAMAAALRGLLEHACIADAAPDDVDEEDRALERTARRLLATTANEATEKESGRG